MATHKQEAELTASHILSYMRYHGDQLIVECLEMMCIEKKFPFGVSLGDVPELYTCNEWLSNFKMHTKIIVDPQIDFHRVDNIYKIFIMATQSRKLS